MDVRVFIYILFLVKESTAHSLNGTNFGKTNLNNFVVGILEASSSRLITIGVAVACHWILAPAHPFPDQSNGLSGEDYLVLTGSSFTVHHPSLIVCHPAYTWGLYTPEDFILFYVKTDMDVRPVFISAKRFPWNVAHCDYIYSANEPTKSFNGLLLHSFKIEVTVVQNCLYLKQRKPIGLIKFYINDILCGKAERERPGICVGKTGGILFCEQLFIGFMIRNEWCHAKTANFTDVGCYANWLQSRVSTGQFIRLDVTEDSSNLLSPKILLIAILNFIILNLIN